MLVAPLPAVPGLCSQPASSFSSASNGACCITEHVIQAHEKQDGCIWGAGDVVSVCAWVHGKQLYIVISCFNRPDQQL